jgi:hypothetical protein
LRSSQNAATSHSVRQSLDTNLQISLFGKLKLANCARPGNRAGFFMPAPCGLKIHNRMEHMFAGLAFKRRKLKSGRPRGAGNKATIRAEAMFRARARPCLILLGLPHREPRRLFFFLLLTSQQAMEPCISAWSLAGRRGVVAPSAVGREAWPPIGRGFSGPPEPRSLAANGPQYRRFLIGEREPFPQAPIGESCTRHREKVL